MTNGWKKAHGLAENRCIMQGCSNRPGRGYVVCWTCHTMLDADERRELSRLENRYRMAGAVETEGARAELWAYRDELAVDLRHRRGVARWRAALRRARERWGHVEEVDEI